MMPLRDLTVRLGIEVDGDGRGGLTLLDEDRAPWDLVLGAVHWLPHFDPTVASARELRRRFTNATESVVRAGVDVLAHPLRYFRRRKVEVPTDLYRPLARLLAETGVAAEINFHTNAPDPRFFAACLTEGVRIALGTDAHTLWEVGELTPHLDVLRQAGCSSADDLRRALYVP
jgi:histidinol phosphatase-like PHP family hydrolase